MHEFLGYLSVAAVGAVSGGIVSYLYGAKIKADIQKVLNGVKKVI